MGNQQALSACVPRYHTLPAMSPAELSTPLSVRHSDIDGVDVDLPTALLVRTGDPERAGDGALDGHEPPVAGHVVPLDGAHCSALAVTSKPWARRWSSIASPNTAWVDHSGSRRLP